jgi:hypothetical protein
MRIESNQYIPYKAKKSPNGFPLAETYYYLVNEKNQTLDKKTLKPYKGKQMQRYAFKTISEAELILTNFNK